MSADADNKMRNIGPKSAAWLWIGVVLSPCPK